MGVQVSQAHWTIWKLSKVELNAEPSTVSSQSAIDNDENALAGEDAMIDQAEAVFTPTQSRTDRAIRPEFRVLIEVPKLVLPRRHSARVGIASKTRIEAVPGFRMVSKRRPPKRRLKREVRVAGCLLLACLPLVYGVSRAWSGQLSEIAATELTRPTDLDDEIKATGIGSTLARQVSRSVFEPAVVLMSIEPAQSSMNSDQEAPVKFPGYLLPADSHEDTAHEGS